MATQTTNYGLTKPSYNETADIGVINSNMDIIDAKMKEIDNKAGSGGGGGNTNTYGHVKVGSVTIDASGDDTIELVAGSNVTLTPDTTSKSVTISATGGGGTSVTVDSELSNTSENPVQNKVITQALNEKGTYSKPTGGIPKTDLASEVQTSLENADNVSTLATEVDSISSTIDNQGESGYLGNGNLCDYSKIEVGIGWSGSANAARGRILIPFKSGDTYSVSVNAEALPKFKYLAIREIDKSTNANSLKNTNITETNLSYTDTLTSGANYIAVTFDCGTDTFYASMLDGVKIMVEKGNEIHSYMPYSKSNVELTNEKANNDIISDAWDASTTYAVGQYCIYNNLLWKCLVQNKGQTPKTGTYWTKVSVANEITSVNNSLEEVKTYIDNTTSTSSFKVLRKNGVVYVFFEGVVISNASAGNIITFSDENLKPKHNSYFPVSRGNVVSVRSDGKVSLYSSDLTEFTTGAVFGSFSYLAK